MVRTFKRFSFLLGAVLLILGGCSSWRTSDVQQLNQQPIDRSEASEIVLDQDPREETGLLEEAFSVDNGDGDEGEGQYSEVRESTGNEKDFYYIKSYSESMAQFSYFNQIYRYDPVRDQSVLLYETEEAIWVNELAAADHTVYWVEYLPEDRIVYNVMQFDLDTGEAKCIASRNNTGELCLSASDGYVTWYDQTLDDNNVSIVIYDVRKQEFLPIEDDVQLAAPYERLDIVDDGITYFSEDEVGNLYINRYNLISKKKDSLMLGDKKNYDRLAGCFSDSEYIGWFEKYGSGPYYLYHVESGDLYCLEPSKGMNVFTARVSSGRLYVLDSSGKAVYIYDPATGDTQYQKLSSGCIGLRFRQRVDGGLYLNAKEQGKDILFSIQE